MQLRPVVVAGIAIVALVMFGLSISYGRQAVESVVPTAEVRQAIATPPPPATPTPFLPPPPERAPPEPAAPPPPQVFYIQAPPQIIYVQVPGAAPAAEAAARAEPAVARPSSEGLPAPPCAFFTGQAMLNAWLATHPEHTAALSLCNLPPAPPPTPVVVIQTVVVPGPTFTPTLVPTATPSPTATPVLVRGQVVINFAGAPNPRPTVAKDFAVAPGSNAWDAIRQAIGPENIAFRDFGPGLGIFITGFYGVVPSGNQFWEFLINGVSAPVGVSSYTVRAGDIIEFRISTF